MQQVSLKTPDKVLLTPSSPPKKSVLTGNITPLTPYSGISTPQELQKVIPPPPGFKCYTAPNSAFRLDQDKIIQDLQKELQNSHKELKKFKSLAESLKKQVSPRKYSMNELFDMLKIDEVMECWECESLKEANKVLQEKLNSQTEEKQKVLSSFHELFDQYQKLQKENEKLVESALQNSNKTKLLQKLNELKTEVKEKDQEIQEMRQYIRESNLKSTEELNKVISSNKDSLEHTKQELKSQINELQKNIHNKDTIIRNFEKVISENIPQYTQTLSTPQCLECQNKESTVNTQKKNIEELNEYIKHYSQETHQWLLEKDQTINSLKRQLLKFPVINCENSALRELGQTTHLLINSLKSVCKSNSPWSQQVAELVSKLANKVEVICKNSKQLLDNQEGKQLRTQVHKHIIEIEKKFLELEETDPATEEIKKLFLELPLLLKPLFDQNKKFENQFFILDENKNPSNSS